MYNILVMYFKLFFNLIVPLTDPISRPPASASALAASQRHRHRREAKNDCRASRRPRYQQRGQWGVAMANGKV